MRTYKYRLTITFKSGRQWQLGVNTELIGDSVARDVGKNTEDVANICLSSERTGQITWLRPGSFFLS